jgi:hypothetical protein
MAEIRFTQRDHWALFEAEGVLTVGEVVQTLRSVYPTLTSHYVIWDMTRTTDFDVTIEHCHEMARAAKAASEKRSGGKTAFVARDQVLFSIQCMYTAIATLEDIPIEYSVFHTMGEAVEWLLRSSNPPIPLRRAM